MAAPLNLFYEEPDADRWLPLDRYPRRLIRRLVRGPARPGGQMRVFLNLAAGLQRIGQPYRVNDYGHARRHRDELCCILGKRAVLHDHPWRNPLMVGPCIHNHPLDDPELLHRHRVQRVLVPGPWMQRMCAPYWGDRVHAWPVGLDTDYWSQAPRAGSANVDVVVYDKVRWNRPVIVPQLISPLLSELERRRLRVSLVRYGKYEPDEYRDLLRQARFVVYVCEHETQGLACEEALACGVPVVVWEHGGPWQDPEYFPNRVVFSPVTCVPYWDSRCGERFASPDDFPATLDRLFAANAAGRLDPRGYVLENLTLDRCAAEFLQHATAALAGQPG